MTEVKNYLDKLMKNMIQLFLLDINVINDYEIMENGDKIYFFRFILTINLIIIS